MGVSFFINVHAGPITGRMNIGRVGTEKVRSFMKIFFEPELFRLVAAPLNSAAIHSIAPSPTAIPRAITRVSAWKRLGGAPLLDLDCNAGGMRSEMMGKGSKTKPPPQAPNSRGLKFFIGFGFLAGLMLFLFWPVVKFLVSLVAG
jgi:hypothetical protein